VESILAAVLTSIYLYNFGSDFWSRNSVPSAAKTFDLVFYSVAATLSALASFWESFASRAASTEDLSTRSPSSLVTRVLLRHSSYR
jgi:hypothetical protein